LKCLHRELIFFCPHRGLQFSLLRLFSSIKDLNSLVCVEMPQQRTTTKDASTEDFTRNFASTNHSLRWLWASPWEFGIFHMPCSMALRLLQTKCCYLLITCTQV
jgi:hypothetical protein